MAAELDFQAIVDLVGDKLREVFQTGDMGIRWYDAETDLMHYLYEYEHGVRLQLAPRRLRPDEARVELAETLRSRRSSSTAVAEHDGVGVDARSPGTDTSWRRLSVPILGATACSACISLENHERENAFGEAEVRLLSTVAASMGVALENARLFDETQRLLKETEQRAAELAVINSIQEGMAAELDFQAIIDLVGDKLREVFKPATSASAGTTTTSQARPLPLRLRARCAADRDSRAPAPNGLGAQLVRTRRTPIEQRYAGSGRAPDGNASRAPTRSKSMRLDVPILGSDRVLGGDHASRTTSARTPSASRTCAC